MARVNIYLPDELADQARSAGINVSAVSRSAIEREVTSKGSTQWLDRVATLPRSSVTHDQVVSAVRAAREELDGGDDGR